MVFDEDALPLTRSWCLFELLQTHHFSASQRGRRIWHIYISYIVVFIIGDIQCHKTYII